MPDLITAYRGGPSDVGADAGASTGITLTAHATIHTKNATWTELVATTAHETTFVVVTLSQTSSNGSFMVDIGVGASTAEVTLIPNLFVRNAVVGQQHPAVYAFPLAIPKGTRVSARCQSSVTVLTIKVGIQCFAGPITGQHGLRRVETAGVLTGTTAPTALNDPGATPHTDGTWTQLLAATTHHWRWMCVSAANPGDSTTAAITGHLVDIGVGAGGAEVAIVNDLWFLNHTATDMPVPVTYCFPCAIAAGSRITGRHRESTGTATDRRLYLALYGVG
jgi:hypothetical protein